MRFKGTKWGEIGVQRGEMGSTGVKWGQMVSNEVKCVKWGQMELMRSNEV